MTKPDWFLVEDGTLAIDINKITTIFLNTRDEYSIHITGAEEAIEVGVSDGKQIMNELARRARVETPLR